MLQGLRSETLEYIRTEKGDSAFSLNVDPRIVVKEAAMSVDAAYCVNVKEWSPCFYSK